MRHEFDELGDYCCITLKEFLADKTDFRVNRYSIAVELKGVWRGLQELL